MEINMRNDAFKHQGRYQGLYERSEILVNGKPSWKNSFNAIWYIPKRNGWVVGNLTDLGHNDKDRDKHNMYANANALRYRLYHTRLTDHTWKYWNGSEWKPEWNSAIYDHDLIVHCKGM